MMMSLTLIFSSGSRALIAAAHFRRPVHLDFSSQEEMRDWAKRRNQALGDCPTHFTDRFVVFVEAGEGSRRRLARHG